jgi:hypothetical protein
MPVGAYFQRFAMSVIFYELADQIVPAQAG